MRKLTLLLTCLFCAHARAACDSGAAKDVREGLGGFGTWTVKRQTVDFRWRPDLRDMPPVAKATVMKQFARSDACLNGHARAIDFYLDGKLIARALADGRYHPLSKEFELPDGPRIDAYLKINTK